MKFEIPPTRTESVLAAIALTVLAGDLIALAIGVRWCAAILLHW